MAINAFVVAVTFGEFDAGALLSDILTGIVGGVITAIAIYWFSIIWKKLIIPWHEERVYRGVQIDGTWKLDPPAEGAPLRRQWTQVETLNIQQQAHVLRGTVTLAPKVESEAVVTLELDGKICDRFVTMVMTSPNRSRTSIQVLLAEVTHGGEHLVGHASFYDIENEKLSSQPVTYRRT